MYLTTLAASLQEAECQLHAYVLMTNHVHLLVTPRTAASAAQLTISIGRRYARYFNDTYERSGPLWEGRYRSSAIDSDVYFLACCRYIEANPVRAGIVTHPGHYEWSSYRANVLQRHEPWLSAHACYLALGAGAHTRAQSYAKLFEQDLGRETLDRIRKATMRGASVSLPAPPRGRPVAQLRAPAASYQARCVDNVETPGEP
jgi:putative transposase